MTTESLAKIEEQFPVLQVGIEKALAAIEANLGGEKLRPGDLDQIRVPSGGSTSWQIHGGLGEAEEKTIEGVIVHTNLQRAYWKEGIEESGGGTPPDCYSNDSITGVGDPGGDCETCPLAQFGSDDRGVGQACKQTRLLFILLPEESLPSVVVVPPSGLQNVKKYLLALAKRGKPAWHAVSRLELEKDKSTTGISFARVKPTLASWLPDEAAAAMSSYADQLRPQLRRVRVDDVEPMDLSEDAA